MTDLFQYAMVQDVDSDAEDDTALVRRVACSYRLGAADFGGHGASFWGSFDAKHSEFKVALEQNDHIALRHLLRNPSETELFWGFDDLAKPFVSDRLEHPEKCPCAAESIYNSIVQIAIATAAIRCPYPEQAQTNSQIPIEELLAALDTKFGFRIDFPNPFPFEFGLVTSRGIASYRAVQALYQAWRVKQILLHVNGRTVLEVGAGLGRNAYYAHKFGINFYTIVDIPSTQLAQGYYLGRIMQNNAVSLFGEPDSSVRLRTPSWLSSTPEDFDVVLNVDSLTEMDRHHALAYVKFARDRSRAFLSINHEFNPTTMPSLFEEAEVNPVSRSPYWARPGYVEEMFLSPPPYPEREELRLIKESTSWRITAPLRWAKLRLSGRMA
ncbi:hypothetical protein [Bradyrhizobium septentrionale]|uniref:Sugar O-methyltransferase n=1 Tax=Bradyrhizobium septentrionale TaxID=1404411 RepID=A0ABZ2NR60_9BRAD